MSTQVVIAGGGVAALEAALALQAVGEGRVEVELIAPEPHFWYRPLAVAAPFDLGDVRRFELAELAAAAGATFSLGAVTAVDDFERVIVTSSGGSSPYDVLLVACGATPVAVVPGALTFRGPPDVDRIRTLLEELVAGQVERVAFCVPWGAVWSLPLYELALMTAAYVAERELHVELMIVTPKDEPLQIFGRAAGETMRTLLEERGVAFHAGSVPIELAEGELRMFPRGTIAADRAVALPRLRGARIDGLPQTADGFIPVDEHGRVERLSRVFAAGDITTFPVKQGGIATQQADAAALMIAADAGAKVTPQPFRPVLRGLLLTGRTPRYLVHDMTVGAEGPSTTSPEPLWWPPAKIAGHYLAPFLAGLAGEDAADEGLPAPPGAVTIEVALEQEGIEGLAAYRPQLESLEADAEGPRVEECMSVDLIVLAPEDTLAEAAQKIRAADAGPALVCDAGRLIGILSSHDLLRAFGGRVHPSEARAREWMTADPISVPRGTALAAAVNLMIALSLHYVPVVDEELPVGLLELRKAVRQVQGRSGIGLGF